MPTQAQTQPPTLPYRQRAFTLIELLVVIAILAILISILLPSLTAARQTAQAGVCLTNLRRISTSSMLYLERSDGRFAPFRLSSVDGTTYVNSYGRQKPRWQWFLAFDSGAPIDPPQGGPYPWGDSVTRTMTNNYYLCPSLTGPFAADIRNGAYGYNYQYLGNSRTHTAAPAYDNYPVSENDITTPSRMVIFADSRGGAPDHGAHSYTLDPPRLAIERNAAAFGPGSSDGPIQHSPAEARHRGRAVASFVDGHAETMTLEQLGYDIGADGVVVPAFDGSGTADNALWTGAGFDGLR